MSVIHVGTEVTLALIDSGDISNNDVAYIWLNDYARKMVFDSTSDLAEDTSNHPYYVRPHDFADPGTLGVWIEDVGAGQPEAWAGSSIATGVIQSVNWSASEGSEIDLDNGTIKLGGSASPAFSVTAAGVLTATGAVISGTLTAVLGSIGGWTIGTYKISADSGQVGLNSEATGGTDVRFWAGHTTPSSAPFQVTEGGDLIATSATITGAITATSGTIGGFTVDSTEGLYAGTGATRVQMKPAVGIWTGATAQADALNYLDVDGSGWLADGNISWDSAGVISGTIVSGSDLTLEGGADLIFTGNDSDPGEVQWEGGTYDVSMYLNTVGNSFYLLPKTDDASSLYIGSDTFFGASTDKYWANIRIWSRGISHLMAELGSGAAQVQKAECYAFTPENSYSLFNINVNYDGDTAVVTVYADSTKSYVSMYNANVGIGKAGADYPLHVQDESAGVTPMLMVEQDLTGDAHMAFKLISGIGWSVGLDNSDGDKFKIAYDDELLATNTCLTINASKDIGIGTTSPLARLHVEDGAGPATSYNASTRLAVESSGYTYISANGTIAGLLFPDAASTIAGGIKYTHSTDQMEFLCGAQSRFYINSSTGVGIKKSSPTYDLQIEYSTTNTASANLPCVLVKNTNTSGASLASVEVHAENGTVQFAAIADGAGTVYGGTPCTYLRTWTNNDMLLGTNTGIRMVVKASGRVGIATTAPGQIFDVNQGSGNMIADGYDNHSLSDYKEEIEEISDDLFAAFSSVKIHKYKRVPYVPADYLAKKAKEIYDIPIEVSPDEALQEIEIEEEVEDGFEVKWIIDGGEAKQVTKAKMKKVKTGAYRKDVKDGYEFDPEKGKFYSKDTQWQRAFPMDGYRGGKMLNCPDPEIKAFIDAEADKERNKLRKEDKWKTIRMGLVADDPSLENLPQLIARNDAGEPVGISLSEQVGLLHAVVKQLVAEVQLLKSQ